MGVCTSKQNRGFDDRHQHQNAHEHSSTLHNKSLSMKHSVHNQFRLIVIGYIRQITNKYDLLMTSATSDNTIKKLCTMYYGSLHTDLIIKPGKTLKLNDSKQKIFQYNSILIKQNATLCINRWNPKTKTGGLLNIICSGNITMEEGSTITLTGRGYHGGDHGRTGESYHTKSVCSKTRKCNYGAGGGGQISICGEYGAQSSCGGGGGYATNGCDGKMINKKNEHENENECINYYNDEIQYGIGGNCYGDKYLTDLYFGSGGGSGYYFDETDNSLRSNKGGAAGGAVKIKCLGDIIMHKNSKIECNGNKGKGTMSGAGAGGSIHILCNKSQNLQMNDNAKIEAIGGVNINNCGNGSDGRIRIQFLSQTTCTTNVCYDNVTPKPYVG